MCGPDRDLDSWPDYDLGCADVKCRKVKRTLEQYFSEDPLKAPKIYLNCLFMVYLIRLSASQSV